MKEWLILFRVLTFNIYLVYIYNTSGKSVCRTFVCYLCGSMCPRTTIIVCLFVSSILMMVFSWLTELNYIMIEEGTMTTSSCLGIDIYGLGYYKIRLHSPIRLLLITEDTDTEDFRLLAKTKTRNVIKHGTCDTNISN